MKDSGNTTKLVEAQGELPMLHARFEEETDKMLRFTSKIEQKSGYLSQMPSEPMSKQESREYHPSFAGRFREQIDKLADLNERLENVAIHLENVIG